MTMGDRVAVMKDGRVLQVGPPKELYERPRTRFVADFVGTNNLVAGEVRERQGERVVVSTALGMFEAISPGAVQERCVLAVRPENIALTEGSGGHGNVVRGRISFVSYLGNTLRYDLEASTGHVLKADIRDPWHHQPFPVGREVTASFPASVTLAVLDE
jgi:ABC-type Fe3+/spermidine/putrescine transport system ATPase subunit